MPKYTEKYISQVLQMTRGNIAEAADRLRMSYHDLEELILLSPNLKRKKVETRNRRLDLAEKKLLEKIDGGDLRAIMFLLERQGRERGWGLTQGLELSGKDDKNIQIEFVEPLKKK